MRKKGILLLSLAVFLALTAAGLAWLRFSPRGELRSQGPEEAVQAFLDAHDRAFFRAEYARLVPPAVTEFEDADAVAGAIFDAAVPGEDFTFREVPGGSGARQDYILSGGGTDFLLLRAVYADGQWQVEPRNMEALRGQRRALTVTVPEGTSLILNGVPVDETYITDDALPYPDLTALEQRFDDPPCRVVYTVPGIYGEAELEAVRPGGLLLLRSNGTDWEYTVPDAAGHAFCAVAPREARVTVCGAALTGEDVAAAMAFPTRLDIPEELQGYLPDYSVYAAGGLYTPPAVSAALPDGTALAARAEGETLFFSLPGSEELREAHHERVRSFLWALCDYGAGHGEQGYPCIYVVNGTPLSRYIWNAGDSLAWTVGVTLSFQDIVTSDYLPLGEDAFLCRGHVDCTTVTRHETRELSLDYEMLWVNRNGTWLCQDMAFL